MSDQERITLGSSGLERDFVNTALPLLDVFLLLPVLWRPEDQTRGITSGHGGKRPCSRVVRADVWGEPDHGREFSFKVGQVLCWDQNGYIRNPCNTVRMLDTFGGDLETSPPSATRGSKCNTDFQGHRRR